MTMLGAKLFGLLSTLGAAFSMTAVGLVAMQALPDPQTPQDMTKWAFQVGGPLFVALLIVLWFYRRDFKNSLGLDRETTKQVIDLTSKAITSIQEQKASNEKIADSHERLADSHEMLVRYIERLLERRG